MAIVYGEADFERWFRDPRPYLGQRLEPQWPFRDWAGDRFAEWYERGHEIVRLTGDETGLSGFEADWYPDGVRAYHRIEEGRTIGVLVTKFAAENRAEVLRELRQAAEELGATGLLETIIEHSQR